MWNLWQSFENHYQFSRTILKFLANILKNHYYLIVLIEKGKLNNDKEKLCPFLPKSYFFVSPRCCCFRVKKHLYFDFFSINSQVILKNSRPLASNFSILLSNLLKKISIQEFYDTETTTARRKQKNKTLVDRK